MGCDDRRVLLMWLHSHRSLRNSKRNARSQHGLFRLLERWADGYGYGFRMRGVLPFNWQTRQNRARCCHSRRNLGRYCCSTGTSDGGHINARLETAPNRCIRTLVSILIYARSRLPGYYEAKRTSDQKSSDAIARQSGHAYVRLWTLLRADWTPRHQVFTSDFPHRPFSRSNVHIAAERCSSR